MKKYDKKHTIEITAKEAAIFHAVCLYNSGNLYNVVKNIEETVGGYDGLADFVGDDHYIGGTYRQLDDILTKEGISPHKLKEAGKDFFTFANGLTVEIPTNRRSKIEIGCQTYNRTQLKAFKKAFDVVDSITVEGYTFDKGEALQFCNKIDL